MIDLNKPLDGLGLSQVNAIINDRLAKKQNTLTPGDGISIEEDTISAELPTKALTSAEYDALSDEEKQADVAYIITDDNLGPETDKWYSRPNLLDNGYWANKENIINQIGKTEYTAMGYTIDRWKIVDNNTKISIEDGSVTIHRKDPSKGVAEFLQYTDLPVKLKDDIFTLSVLASDNKLYFVSERPSNQNVVTTAFGEWGIFLYNVGGVTRIGVNIAVGNVDSLPLCAAKLELSAQQTLAHQDEDGNWVLNDPPPDKTSELLKCQRYYRNFDRLTFILGEIWGTSHQSQKMIHTPMRVAPTVSIGSGSIPGIGELPNGTFGLYVTSDSICDYVKPDAVPNTNLAGRYLNLDNVVLDANL